MQDMSHKEVTTIRKATGELKGGFLLYGIPFGILYSLIYNHIVNKIVGDSYIAMIIITIILQGIIVFFIWQSSTATTFKKRALYREDVSIVMRNLTIFTIIISVVSAITNFNEVNSKFDRLEKSYDSLSYMFKSYDDDQLKQYQEKKQKIVDEAKSRLYGYLAVLDVGLFVVYLGVLPFEKKFLLKHVV